jgi:murein DD-endopeptidase MepM/ murein hydrolase activator NlpD
MNKLGAGKKYTIFFTKDSLKEPRCFIYEPNAREYVVFDFRDTTNVYKVEKEVSTHEKSLGGIIEKSLSHTIAEKGVDYSLTNKLADVFKWAIDFFALDKGDRFRMLYDEVNIEGVPVSTGRINGAAFTHRGKTYYAIYFEKDGKGGYYDLEGNAMKSRFLQAPLEFTRISSKFSMNRMHPILKRAKPHLGTDYAAPHGTPIVSVADGVVEEATQRGGNGKFVKVKHDNVYSTQYLHMSRFAEGIRKGVRVQQGQVIGYVGSTGLATGPHLCFRFWKNGQQVDPFKEIPKNGEPLADNVKPEYLLWKDQVLERLNKVGYHNNIRNQTVENIRLGILN